MQISLAIGDFSRPLKIELHSFLVTFSGEYLTEKSSRGKKRKMREKASLQPWGIALLLLLSSLLASVQAKYIFTEEPLARFSPAAGDTDLFGYATTLHLVDDSGSDSDFEHAIQNTK